jgi:hypothetical protein
MTTHATLVDTFHVLEVLDSNKLFTAAGWHVLGHVFQGRGPPSEDAI